MLTGDERRDIVEGREVGAMLGGRIDMAPLGQSC